MTRPPKPNQRRYRGRLRADIRSAWKHVSQLLFWDARYRNGAFGIYPNQLAPFADVNEITAVATILLGMLNAKGPIPSRAP